MFDVRLQILISPEQRRRLEVEARRRKVSVASVIREAIDSRYGTVAPEERIRAVDEIGRMQGRFVPPEELRRLIDEEREQTLPRSPERRAG
jgi:ribosome maturation protein Sdo1